MNPLKTTALLLAACLMAPLASATTVASPTNGLFTTAALATEHLDLTPLAETEAQPEAEGETEGEVDGDRKDRKKGKKGDREGKRKGKKGEGKKGDRKGKKGEGKKGERKGKKGERKKDKESEQTEEEVTAPADAE